MTPDRDFADPGKETIVDSLDLANWPGHDRREPAPSQRNYLVLSALVKELRSAISRHLGDRHDLRVLDIGCGEKPYLPLIANRAVSYTGIDVVPGPYVDVTGGAESLPFDDAAFDVVLCTQALEHLQDPGAAVAEIHRVLAPGGLALVSTHGVYLFHPSPPESDQDYWRWTHAGLARVFQASGPWTDIDVRPSGEVIACLAVICLWYLDGALERLAPDWLRRAMVASVNRVAERLDARFPATIRVPSPGPLSVNYLVVAVR